jgi:choline kinase
MKVKNCLILAAGNGGYMRPTSNRGPKPMAPVCSTPLLEHIIVSAQQAGIAYFDVVVGYRGGLIEKYFADRQLAGASLKWIENPDYQKGSGISVLSARGKLNGKFLLVLGDHLFQAETAERLLKEPAHEGEVVVGVDKKIHDVFDIDEATKVRLDGEWVIDLGRRMPDYDAVETGMFLCTSALFEALESSMQNGDCDLTDGLRKLAGRRCLRAFDVGGASWVHVDTPFALAYAESLLEQHDSLTDWSIVNAA